MLIIKILIGILIFGLIVIFHEFGHFLLAKKNGIGVTEFAVGLGPKIWSTNKNETMYAIRCIPFGGYCRMVGELEEEDAENSFGKKSVWARISVIAAGPIFNFVLAFLLALVVVGFNGWDYAKITVSGNLPAKEAGLKDGDIITAINGHNIICARDIDNYLTFHPLDGSEVSLEVKRDGEKININVTPKFVSEYELTGFTVEYTDEEIIIETIKDDSPFYKAGVNVGDKIVGINGTRISSRKELSDYLLDNTIEKNIDIEYIDKDSGQTEATEVELTEKSERYLIGFSFNAYLSAREKVGALQTVYYSGSEVKYWIKTTFQSLGMIVRGKVKLNDFAGPVGIVDLIGDAYDSSMEEGGIPYTIITMFFISIFLSANIGVMNLLPIPALDGGRLLFLLIEAIFRKPVKPEVEGIIHAVGLILLFIFMIIIMFNDIGRLF